MDLDPRDVLSNGVYRSWRRKGILTAAAATILILTFIGSCLLVGQIPW